MMSNARESFRKHQILANVGAAVFGHAHRRTKARILGWIKHKYNRAALAKVARDGLRRFVRAGQKMLARVVVQHHKRSAMRGWLNIVQLA